MVVWRSSMSRTVGLHTATMGIHRACLFIDRAEKVTLLNGITRRTPCPIYASPLLSRPNWRALGKKGQVDRQVQVLPLFVRQAKPRQSLDAGEDTPIAPIVPAVEQDPAGV